MHNVCPQDQTKISLGSTKQLGILSDMDNNSNQVQTTGFLLVANMLAECCLLPACSLCCSTNTIRPTNAGTEDCYKPASGNPLTDLLKA